MIHVSHGYQDRPLLSNPRLVFKPESVKYCKSISLIERDNFITHTKGKNMIDTISSSFSVSAIARPPSRGTMSPARNAPTP
jgi:hypothetical protein